MGSGLGQNCTCTTRPCGQQHETINRSLRYLVTEEIEEHYIVYRQTDGRTTVESVSHKLEIVFYVFQIIWIIYSKGTKHNEDFNLINNMEYMYITRFEPVGKSYREVCLQTKLWPLKVHHPSSWSLYLSELALKLKEFFFLFCFFFFLNGFIGLYWTFFQ